MEQAVDRIAVPYAEIAEFCRRNRIKRLELFGSVLRGDFSADSDVDVLVEFLPEARVGLVALSRMQRELTALIGRRVDLVPREGLKPIIRDDILSSAETLYAA